MFYAFHGFISVTQGFGATQALKAVIEDKANANARSAGLAAYTALCEQLGTAAEPFLAPLLPTVLEQCGDKVRTFTGASRLPSQTRRGGMELAD